MSEAAGSSPASLDPGATESADHASIAQPPQDAPGGGVSRQQQSNAVRTNDPAKVYDDQGEEVDVPQPTIDAIEAYQPPPGFHVEGAREDSFLYSLGNYIVPSGVVDKTSASFTASFKCQFGACRTATGKKLIPCPKGNKSNVNKHFRNHHKVRGSKGATRQENTQNQQGNIKAAMAAAKTFNVGERRVKELQAAKLVVDKLLPFTFFSSGDMFKEMMATATGSTSYPALPPRRVKHLIVELYSATKKVVMGNMLDEVKKAPLPILHHMIDIWTDKGSGRKFLGVHLSHVDANFELKDTLLSVKRYSPSQGALGEAKASEVLLDIVKSVLHEFGLDLKNLASGTTDSGSDVKAAAEQGFGIHLDPAKSKNPEARDLLRNVIKVVENLNKSSNLRAKFEDLQVEMLGDVFKIVKHAPQRWLSLTRTLERIIRLWHVLRKLYSDEGKNFPLEEGDNKNGILQLYSLLQPLSSITRDGQYGGAPMTADIYMKFGVLKMGVLDPSKDLKVFDIPPIGEDGLPDRQNQKNELPHQMVSPDDLHPTATKAREEMCRALVSRFYGRVWDDTTPDPSFFCDAACLLTPPFSEGHHLAAMKLTAEEAAYLPANTGAVAPTLDEEVKEKLDECWAEIKKRAVQAIKTQQDRPEGGGGSEGPFKRPRTRSGPPARKPAEENPFAVFGRTQVVDDDEIEQDVVEQEVGSEIMRYKGLFMKPKDLPPSEVLGYWGTKGKYAFPSLKYVAQQTFGNQASAAPVERDFSGCGLFLVPNRSRVEEYWVEMVMFLKANYRFIPGYGDIPSIDSRDIRSCLPAKFNGTDEDLLKAEMALDPLSNGTPPNEADIGLDG